MVAQPSNSPATTMTTTTTTPAPAPYKEDEDGSSNSKKEPLAYAKLWGKLNDEPFSAFILSLPTTLGRGSAATEGKPKGFVDLGKSKALSREHAVISWAASERQYSIKCLGKNGMVVSGKYRAKGGVEPLQSRTPIKLGPAHIYFLLPEGDFEHDAATTTNTKSNGAGTMTGSVAANVASTPGPGTQPGTATAAKPTEQPTTTTAANPSLKRSHDDTAPESSSSSSGQSSTTATASAPPSTKQPRMAAGDSSDGTSNTGSGTPGARLTMAEATKEQAPAGDVGSVGGGGAGDGGVSGMEVDIGGVGHNLPSS